MPGHYLNYAERLRDVLRAEAAGEDLQESDEGIHVCAMAQDRSLYELGRVSAAMVYQDPVGALSTISRIKFYRTEPRK